VYTPCMVGVLTVAYLGVKDTFWTVGILVMESPPQEGGLRMGAAAEGLHSVGDDGLELATAAFLAIGDLAAA
jgi:hypothetical protein